MKLNFGKNFLIRQKLLYGFGLILIAVLLNSILTIFTLNRSTNLNNKVTNTYGPTVQNLGELDNLITQSKMLIRNWVFVDKQPGTPDKVRLADLHSKDWPELKTSLESLTGKWDNQEDEELLHQIFFEMDSLFSMHRHIMENLNSFDAYEDIMLFFEAEDMVMEGRGIMLLSDNITDKVKILSDKYAAENQVALDEMRGSFSNLTWGNRHFSN